MIRFKVVLPKCVGRITHLRFAGRKVQGHVIGLLLMEDIQNLFGQKREAIPAR